MSLLLIFLAFLYFYDVFPPFHKVFLVRKVLFLDLFINLFFKNYMFKFVFYRFKSYYMNVPFLTEKPMKIHEQCIENVEMAHCWRHMYSILSTLLFYNFSNCIEAYLAFGIFVNGKQFQNRQKLNLCKTYF